MASSSNQPFAPATASEVSAPMSTIARRIPALKTKSQGIAAECEERAHDALICGVNLLVHFADQRELMVGKMRETIQKDLKFKASGQSSWVNVNTWGSIDIDTLATLLSSILKYTVQELGKAECKAPGTLKNIWLWIHNANGTALLPTGCENQSTYELACQHRRAQCGHRELLIQKGTGFMDADGDCDWALGSYHVEFADERLAKITHVPTGDFADKDMNHIDMEYNLIKNYSDSAAELFLNRKRHDKCITFFDKGCGPLKVMPITGDGMRFHPCVETALKAQAETVSVTRATEEHSRDFKKARDEEKKAGSERDILSMVDSPPAADTAQGKLRRGGWGAREQHAPSPSARRNE